MDNNLVVCGGTFDHFHKGHEEFLNHAFSLGKKVIIGITSDNYINHSKSKIKKSELIEAFSVRKQSVLDFIKAKGVKAIEIMQIDDLFGPTLSKDLLMDAIVVSHDTEKGAEIINKKRKDLSLSMLKIYVAPLVKAGDSKPISSERIRRGEINKMGRLYVRQSWLNTDLILSENLRQEFKVQMGSLFQEVDLRYELDSSLLITVGDETTKKFNENHFNQDISVVDFKIAS